MAIIDLITEKFLKIESYQDQDWGTCLENSSGALEALHQEPMYLMQSSEALIFDAPKDNLTHLSEADI